MRLIDADSLEKEIYKWMPKDQKTWIDSEIPPIENLVVSIMMTIQEQSTVDAIPVEWLKEHYPTTQVYGTEQYFRTAYAVQDILAEWGRKEE